MNFGTGRLGDGDEDGTPEEGAPDEVAPEDGAPDDDKEAGPDFTDTTSTRGVFSLSLESSASILGQLIC